MILDPRSGLNMSRRCHLHRRSSSYPKRDMTFDPQTRWATFIAVGCHVRSSWPKYKPLERARQCCQTVQCGGVVDLKISRDPSVARMQVATQLLPRTFTQDGYPPTARTLHLSTVSTARKAAKASLLPAIFRDRLRPSKVLHCNSPRTSVPWFVR